MNMLAWSYFSSPDYLVIKAWIRTTMLFPSFIELTGTNVCMYGKIVPRVVGYRASGIPQVYKLQVYYFTIALFDTKVFQQCFSI